MIYHFIFPIKPADPEDDFEGLIMNPQYRNKNTSDSMSYNPYIYYTIIVSQN